MINVNIIMLYVHYVNTITHMLWIAMGNRQLFTGKAICLTTKDMSYGTLYIRWKIVDVPAISVNIGHGTTQEMGNQAPSFVRNRLLHVFYPRMKQNRPTDLKLYPNVPCMEYLHTFTPKMAQMQVPSGYLTQPWKIPYRWKF